MIENTLPYISLKTRLLYQEKVADILRSGKLIEGYYNQMLESKAKSFLGVPHVATLSDATSALFLIFKYYNLENTEVLFPSNTFISPVFSAENAKVKIKLVDINLEDFNIDYDDLKRKITKKTKALVLTHIAGTVSKDIDKIKKLCKASNILLIEDASHAFGASINNAKAGAIGNVAVFSMYATKIITGGTGALIASNDIEFDKFIRKARHHGNTGASNDFLSGDFLLSEFNALLACLQLDEIQDTIMLRNNINYIYRKELKEIFADVGVHFQYVSDNATSSFYKEILFFENASILKKISDHLKEKQVKIGHCYQVQLHQQKTVSISNETFPNATLFSKNHLSLPCHLGLSSNEIDYVVKSVKESLE